MKLGILYGSVVCWSLLTVSVLWLTGGGYLLAILIPFPVLSFGVAPDFGTLVLHSTIFALMLLAGTVSTGLLADKLGLDPSPEVELERVASTFD